MYKLIDLEDLNLFFWSNRGFKLKTREKSHSNIVRLHHHDILRKLFSNFGSANFDVTLGKKESESVKI
jgi:hypothetical protein